MTQAPTDLETQARAQEMSGDTHRQLHWAAIRSVCRDRKLNREIRRRKLRFLVEGLARSARWAVAR